MTVKVQGRLLSPAHLEEVRQLLGQYPEWSRWRLSQELCARWQWRNPKGQLQDMAARALMLKLDQRGLIGLPPRRRAPVSRMRHKKLRPVEHACQPLSCSLAQLRPLEVLELSQEPGQLPLYEWFLHQYHYLSHTSSVGLNLKYLARDRQGRPLGCLLFGSAAWKCAVRDQFIGWSARQREGRLQAITNNTRFLILPWVRAPQLASHLLSLIMRRLRADWQSKYARPLEMVETFVDSSRFSGACYRAANWIDLGQTTGRTRQDRWSRLQVAPKRVLVYPLTGNFSRELCR